MENKNFGKLLALIEKRSEFLEELPKIEQNYLVKIYKIAELDVNSITELYKVMQKKFYLNRKTSNEEAWYENELRIFVWLLFGYTFVHSKAIEDLNEEDWQYFSPIFNYKSTVFFQFQTRSLLKSEGRPTPWTQVETSLLQAIINQKNSKNRWNSIARDLFIRSGKQFFRNPKQCRERWMNHLDPSKIHSEWTATQDLTLLTCIKQKGKRWSLAMKELANTRTQHMVKNRYKSLILVESKKYPGKKQFQIENILIKKLNKILEKQVKETTLQSTKNQVNPAEPTGVQQELNKIQLKEEKYQKPLTPVSNQDKFQMKEQQLIGDEEQKDFNFIQHMRNDFNEFGGQSPLFIPWFSDNAQQPFDIRFVREDGSRHSDPELVAMQFCEDSELNL